MATGNSNCVVGCTFTCIKQSRDDCGKSRTREINKDKEAAAKVIGSSAAATTTTTTTAGRSIPQQLVSSSLDSQSSNTPAASTQRNQTNLNRTNFNLRGHKSDVSQRFYYLIIYFLIEAFVVGILE